MASDRQTPAKRPPRPAAKKASPPPPPRKPSAAASAAAARKKSTVPRRRRRNMKKTIGATVAIVLVGALVVFFAFTVADTGTGSSSTPSAVGPEKVPIPAGKSLANINTGVYPNPVDGIDCQVNEQVVYHIHAHLAIFVDGVTRQVPLGIGMNPPLQMGANTGGDFASGATCFYWLHTHAADGIIHIESPSQQQYTLGNFFHMWGQTLGTGQVGPALGKVTAYVDGKVYTGDPNSIPLANHGTIQLDVGKAVPPSTVDWATSGL